MKCTGCLPPDGTRPKRHAVWWEPPRSPVEANGEMHTRSMHLPTTRRLPSPNSHRAATWRLCVTAGATTRWRRAGSWETQGSAPARGRPGQRQQLPLPQRRARQRRVQGRWWCPRTQPWCLFSDSVSLRFRRLQNCNITYASGTACAQTATKTRNRYMARQHCAGKQVRQGAGKIRLAGSRAGSGFAGGAGRQVGRQGSARTKNEI